MKIVKRNILLNPGPGTTSETVKQALVVADICPREKEFETLLDSVREDLPKVIHGGDDYIAVCFTASGTGGDEAAITSAVPKGNKILVVENGAYGTRMKHIAQTYGIDVVEYKIPYGDFPDVDAIERLLQENSNVSHIAMVHHETTTGMLNPVREVIKMAHKYGVEVIVDAMSSYAGIQIHAKEWDIDYLVSTSNKCIQGMAGLTFVIFKKSFLDKIKDNKRSYYLDIYSQYMGFKNTRQMQFTPPVQIIYALRQALDEYFAETGEKRSLRYTDNWSILYHGMKELGFQMLLPYEQESKILMAIKEPTDSNFSFDAMHDYLYERGFTIYPGKGAKEATFRLAVIGDLYPDDMRSFLIEMKNFLAERKITKFM